MVQELSCPTACRIFPAQGSNQRLLHWQADSLPLSHQGSRGWSLLNSPKNFPNLHFKMILLALYISDNSTPPLHTTLAIFSGAYLSLTQSSTSLSLCKCCPFCLKHPSTYHSFEKKLTHPQNPVQGSLLSSRLPRLPSQHNSCLQGQICHSILFTFTHACLPFLTMPSLKAGILASSEN